MAGVVLDRLVDRRIGRLGLQVQAHAAAEVDLDCVEAPGRERVDVLLVVAIAALVSPAAAFSARVGVQADTKAGGVECVASASSFRAATARG